MMGYSGEYQVAPSYPGSVRRRCPDISKMKKLGYNPKLKFDEALPPSIAWYTKHAKERPR